MPEERPIQRIAPYLRRTFKLPADATNDLFAGFSRRAQHLSSLIEMSEAAFKWGLALLAIEVAGLLPLTLYVLVPAYGSDWQMLFIVAFGVTLLAIIAGGGVALLCWYFLILEIGLSLAEWVSLWVQRFVTLTRDALRPRKMANRLRPGKRKRNPSAR